MSSFETGRTGMSCITCFRVKRAVEGIREDAGLKCIIVVCSPAFSILLLHSTLHDACYRSIILSISPLKPKM